MLVIYDSSSGIDSFPTQRPKLSDFRVHRRVSSRISRGLFVLLRYIMESRVKFVDLK